MMRRLISTRRRVAQDRRDRYHNAWERLAAAVDARDGHAWVFRAADGGSLYIEFLEFAEDADPRADADVARALDDLDRLADGGRPDEWVEAWPETSEGEGRANDGS